MAHQLDFTGQSGAAYRYTLLEDGQIMWPSGGNYLYVRSEPKGPKIVYAGEAESLFRGYRDLWDRARADYGASDIYVRLNISGSVRRAEQEDIVARHQPVMNVGGADEAAEKPARARRPRKAKGA